MGIGNFVFVSRNRTRAIDRSRSRYDSRFEHGAKRCGLEDRARLELRRNGFDGSRAVFDIRSVGRIEKRGRGYGDDLARGGIVENRRSIIAPNVGDPLLETLFEILLHIDIDRQDDVGAVLGRLVDFGSARNGSAVGALLQDELSGGSLQNVVVIQLEARLPIAIDIDQAKNLTRHFAVRIDALHVVEKIDAVQAEVFQSLGLIEVDLALYVCERRILRLKSPLIKRRVAAKGFGELFSRVRNIGYLFGIAVDCLRLHVAREHFSIAIIDCAAARGKIERQRSGGGGLLAVVLRHNDLQIHQSGNDKQRGTAQEGYETASPTGTICGRRS